MDTNTIISDMSNSFSWFSIITYVLAIVFFTVEILDNLSKIIEFLKKAKTFFLRGIKELYYKPKRKHYDKELYSTEYIDWQKKVINVIYGDLIHKANEKLKDISNTKSKKDRIRITSIEFKDGVKFDYEAITIETNSVSYPFGGVCPKELLKIMPEEDKKSKKKEKKKNIKRVRDNNHIKNEYWRMVRATIRYPKRIGYMMDKMIIDEKGYCKFEAHVSRYASNVRNSHVMEYELYKLYKYNSNNFDREFLLKHLPIRNAIHNKFDKSNESDILLSGAHRDTMMGVQVFILIKNHSGSYDTLRIRRSSDVAAKPGYLQFIPSGGFESINDGDDFDSQWSNYSLQKAVFRELLEECFGQDEDDPKFSSNTASPERLYFSSNIKTLLEMLTAKTPTAILKFIGTSMNLVGLRMELCFLLKIEDPSFAAQLTGNYESKAAINLIDIGKLESSEFWVRESQNDLEKLNCTSAGLWELARNTAEYESAKNAAEEAVKKATEENCR